MKENYKNRRILEKKYKKLLRFERKRAVLEDREWNLEDIIDQCDILGIDADFVFKQGLPKVIEMEVEDNGSK